MDGEHTVYCPGVAALALAQPAEPRMMAWSHALVTGGAGFIGSHLTRALLAEGRRVTVLDNLSVGRREAVPDGRAVRARRHARRGRGRRRAARRRLRLPPRRAGHHSRQLRSLSRGSRHQRDGHGAAAARASIGTHVKWFTLASSMAVYADADSPAPIDESHPKRPLSPYGVGKLAAEDVSSQVLDARGIPVHRGPLLQYLRSRPDLHALRRGADDLHHATAARRIDHDLRRRRAATRLHSRQRHRRGDDGDARADAWALQPRHRPRAPRSISWRRWCSAKLAPGQQPQLCGRRRPASCVSRWRTSKRRGRELGFAPRRALSVDLDEVIAAIAKHAAPRTVILAA